MIRATLRKELVGLWTSPVPYVASALVNVTVGMLFLDTLRARDQAVLQPLVPLAGFVMLAVAPALCMRTVAEEVRTGTLDVLLVSKARPGWLVGAKWLAAFGTLVAIMLPIAIHAVLLGWWGDPDPAPMITGALGLVLLAAAATAIGVAASSLTSSLPVAAMGAFVLMLLGWFLQPSPAAASLRTLSARLSLSERVRGPADVAVGAAGVRGRRGSWPRDGPGAGRGRAGRVVSGRRPVAGARGVRLRRRTGCPARGHRHRPGRRGGG